MGVDAASEFSVRDFCCVAHFVTRPHHTQSNDSLTMVQSVMDV